MKSGYHQIKMVELDSKEMAFSYGQGLCQFKRLPFDLCNALAIFQHLMERVLDGLKWKTTLIFLDMIIFRQTFEQKLERLTEVFAQFGAMNLKLSFLCAWMG